MILIIYKVLEIPLAPPRTSEIALPGPAHSPQVSFNLIIYKVLEKPLTPPRTSEIALPGLAQSLRVTISDESFLCRQGERALVTLGVEPD